MHAHYFPPPYRHALAHAGITHAGGFPIMPWTPDLAIGFMDHHGITAQILSISDPGVGFVQDEPPRDLARAINEYAAALVRARPSHP